MADFARQKIVLAQTSPALTTKFRRENRWSGIPGSMAKGPYLDLLLRTLSEAKVS